MDAATLEYGFCVLRSVRCTCVWRTTLYEGPTETGPPQAYDSVVIESGHFQYCWSGSHWAVHALHSPELRLQAVCLRSQLLQWTHLQVLGLCFCPQQSTRAGRHSVHRAPQAAPDLPALVPPHYRAALLLVFLQGPGGRRRLVHVHELRRARPDVQLLRHARCRLPRAQAVRHGHHHGPDRPDGHGPDGGGAGLQLDAGRRLPLLPGQHRLGLADVPELPGSLLHVLLPDVPEGAQRKGHQGGVSGANGWAAMPITFAHVHAHTHRDGKGRGGSRG